MEWLLYAFLAMIFLTVVNLMDKHIVSDELRDPMLVTTVFGIGVSVLFLIVALINGLTAVPVGTALFSLLAGLCYSCALWFYYHVMQKEEVSRFVPILAMEPMFIAVIAFFAFAEKLGVMQYGAIVLIFFGAVLISHQDGRKKSVERKLRLLAFSGVAFFVARNLIFSYVTEAVPFQSILFWLGIGGLIIPVILLMFHHPHLKKKAKKGVQHLVLNSWLSGFAIMFFVKAIAIGQVTVVSALISTKPLLVFVVALFMSKFHPAFISEKNTRKDILKKSVAIVLIVTGGILLVLFN